MKTLIGDRNKARKQEALRRIVLQRHTHTHMYIYIYIYMQSYTHSVWSISQDLRCYKRGNHSDITTNHNGYTNIVYLDILLYP